MWITLDTEKIYGSKRSAVAWSLASHHFLPGLNSSDTICGLSLLLALYVALQSFSQPHPVFLSPYKLSFQKFHLSLEYGRRRATSGIYLC